MRRAITCATVVIIRARWIAPWVVQVGVAIELQRWIAITRFRRSIPNAVSRATAGTVGGIDRSTGGLAIVRNVRFAGTHALSNVPVLGASTVAVPIHQRPTVRARTGRSLRNTLATSTALTGRGIHRATRGLTSADVGGLTHAARTGELFVRRASACTRARVHRSTAARARCRRSRIANTGLRRNVIDFRGSARALTHR